MAIALALVSAGPWFFWGNFYHALFGFLFVAFRLPIIRTKFSSDITPILFWYVLFTFFVSKFLVDPPEESFRKFLGTMLPFLFPILFYKSERKLFLKGLTDIFTWMAFIGLIGFAIKIFFVDLPYTEIENKNPFYPNFKNYYFFILLYDLGFMSRFHGMLTEPGHMGMFCALLLYVNGYTWKNWKNVVLTLSLIWSFSLAGYVLYLVGLLLYKLATTKSITKTVIKIVGVLALLVGGGILYYSPTNDDLVSVAILSRLALDDKKGISGNNRNTASFTTQYEQFRKSEDYMCGMSTKKYNKAFDGTANSSYKVFIMLNGILSFICLIGFILANNYVYPSKISLGFSLLIILSFFQRPYFLWEIQSFIFMCFVPLCYNKNKRKFLRNSF
ncbi:MAG: hypothetical protein K2H46_03410 [Muribaculaceae bacterium]|nr:hypothetical protein [Muribaculaceae bacterium]